MLLLMKIYQTSFKNFTNDLDVFIRFCFKTPFKGSVIYKRLYLVISRKWKWLANIFYTTILIVVRRHYQITYTKWIFNLCIVLKARNLTDCHQSDTMTYLPTGNKSIIFYVMVMRIRRTNKSYCNIIWSKLGPCFIISPAFLYCIFRIGNIANYIKQTHFFNTK